MASVVDDDAQEKYLRLRQEHTSLQQKCNEQDDVIRRMNTKLSLIESNLRTKQKLELGQSHPVPAAGHPKQISSPGRRSHQPRNRENEDLITELYRVNSELQRKNLALESKNRLLTQTIAKHKKELEHARKMLSLRRTPTRPSTAGAAAASITRSRSPSRSLSPSRRSSNHVVLAGGVISQANDLEGLSAQKLAALVEKLRVRLVNYEEQLSIVREENVNLRQAKMKHSGKGPVDEGDLAVAYTMAGKKHRVTADSEEVDRLEHELRDTRARLQLLQTRYEHLEAKNQAQSEIQHSSIDQLEDYNARLRDLRRALQSTQRDKEEAELQAARLPDVEEKNKELKQMNEHLEQQVTKLCESPFISEAFQKQERVARLHDLERQVRAQTLKIEHLQQAAQGSHAEYQAMQKTVNMLREEKEDLLRELEGVRIRYRQTEAGAQLMNDKMKLYAGDDGVDLEELERALTLVRRRAEARALGQDLDFLENTGGEGDLDTLPGLRKKLQVLQVANLNLTRELERSERMLKAQSAINKDLHLEIEELSRRSNMDRKDLQEKLEGFEALALKRLQRLHYLEAQIRQYRYSINRPGGKGDGLLLPLPGMDLMGADAGSEGALIEELATGDFGPDENLLEVWIVGAEITPGALSMGCSSFITVDFFDYESQATSFILGNNPRYDFATSYKLLIDDFLLSYLATETLTLELHQTRQLDYDLMARTEVPLHRLLENRPNVILPKHPLISTKDGSVIGTLHVEIRLALPVAEVYRSFLRQHPEEKVRIERVMAQRMRNGGGPTVAKMMEDAAQLQNEMEITIVQVSDLPKRPGSKLAPLPYVHYQLMGFQDVFTPVAQQSTSATFAHTSTFPITTDAKLLRFLKRYSIGFEVIDYLEDDEEGEGESKNAGEGLIGKAEVSVASLADGNAASETLDLVDENGKSAGCIRVSIKWKYPLKTGRQTGPNALMGVEMAEILSNFSPYKDGLVHYMAFLRYCDPPATVHEALRKIRDFLLKAEQTQGLDTAAVLDHLKDNSSSSGSDPSGVDEEIFINGLTSLNISRLAAEEIIDLFHYLDTRSTGHVGFETMIHLLAPPSNLLNGVIEKVQHRFKELNNLQGLVPLMAFEHFDEEKSRKLTRLKFKEVLVDLGFVLVDEPAIGMDNKRETGERGQQQGGGGRGGYAMEEEDDGLGGRTLRQSSDWTWDGHGRKNSAASRTSELRKRRAEFERRIKELEDAAAKVTVGSLLGGEGKDSEEEKEGKSSKAQGRSPQHQGQKTNISAAAVIKDSGARVGRYSSDDDAAKFIQSNFRTYLLRRNSRASSTMGSTMIGQMGNTTAVLDRVMADEQQDGGAGGGAPAMVEAEKTLMRCMRVSHGVSASPDLRPTFAALDREGKGTVNRKQFAHALRQHPGLLGLSPQQLRTFMDYFDTSNDGTAIDYRAFLVFSEYHQPDLHPAISSIRKMMLHSGSMEALRAFDVDGVGLLTPQDFMEALRELGYGYIGQGALRMIPDLFDFREVIAAGGGVLTGVDYQNFLEFALEQEGSLALRDVESKLRTMVRQLQSSDHGRGDLRSAFARLDVSNTGAVSQLQFGQALDDLGLHLTEDELRVLFSRVDARLTGNVYYLDFVHFIESPPSPRPLGLPHAEFDESSLQAKGSNLLLDASNRGMNISSIGKAFMHYDWRHLGDIPAALFMRAAVLAGLTYTRRELYQLARHFSIESPVGSDFPVNYRKFLGWLLSGQDGNTKNMNAHTMNMATMRATVNPVSGRFDTTIKGGGEDVDVSTVFSHLKELRKKWIREGIDYRVVLERYDDDLKGTISPGDLHRALRELNADLEENEIDKLSRRFSSHGRVAYLELLHSLHERGEGAWEVEEDLRWMIRRRFQFFVPGKLREPFRHFSLGKKTYFTEPDFADGLRALGFKLPIEEEHCLFQKLDMDSNGKVYYPAFVTFVRDPNYEDVETKMIKRIRKLQIGVKEARRVLEAESDQHHSSRHHHSDEDDDSEVVQHEDQELSVRAFRKVLTRLGLDLPSTDIDRIAARYVSSKNEKHVSIELFLRFVKAIEEHNSSSDDESEHEASRSQSSLQVERVIRRLAKIVKAGNDKGLKPDKAFEHFDRNGLGTVDPDDFLDGLEKLNITVTPAECKQVMKKLSAKRGKGDTLLLSCEAFAKALGVTKKDDAAAATSSEGGAKEKAWFSVEEALGTLLKKRPKTLSVLREALNQLDKKGKGIVSREDMRFALDEADVDLSPKHARLLMDHFATGGNEGSVDYRRLLDAFSPAQDSVVAKVRKALEGKAIAERKLHEVFSEYDRKREGLMVRREFRLSLESLGVELPLEDLKVLYKKFGNPEDESLIDYSAFADAVFGEGAAAAAKGDGSKSGLEGVLEKIKSSLQKEGRKPAAIRPKFERADERAKGFISLKQFHRIVDEFELDLDRAEQTLLEKAFDKQKDGYVHYMDFCDRLEAGHGGEGGGHNVAEDTMDYLMELLRRAGEKGVDLVECWEHFDSNKDGNCDELEFQEGLKKLNIRLTKNQVKEVIEKFAGRRHGMIQYKDFVMAVRNSSKKGSSSTSSSSAKAKGDSDKEPVIKVSRTLSMVLTTQLTSVKKARQSLEDADRRGSGKLSPDVFRRALEDVSVDLQENEWKQLLSQLDVGDRGQIQYVAFLKWVSRLKNQEGEEGRGGGSKDSHGRGETEGGSYEGKRKRNVEPHDAIELTVGELHLTDRALVKEHKGAQVWVSYFFLEDHEHESHKEDLRDAQVDLNYSRTFPVSRHSPELRQALVEALHGGRRKAGKGVIVFTVMAKYQGRMAEELGTAKFEVSSLLEECRDAVKEALRVHDERGDKIGSLIITVRGHEALSSAA